MCAPLPVHRSYPITPDARIPALALALRAVLIACALLLAWAQIQPTLAGRAMRGAPVPWAQQFAPDLSSRPLHAG